MESRQALENLHAAINAHDVAGARQFFDPDAHVVTATGRKVTLGGLARLLVDSITAFPDLAIRIERWTEQGDVVVTEEVMEGTHLGDFAGLAPTGRRVRLAICHVNRIVDGRIVERIAYHDSAGILRQLT